MSERVCVDCGGIGIVKTLQCPCCHGLGYHGGAVQDCLSEITPVPGEAPIRWAPQPRKPHAWQIAAINIPGKMSPSGYLYIWVCRACGSCGGRAPKTDEKLEVKGPSILPFLAGTPLIDLPMDCNEAKKLVDNLVEKYPCYQENLERGRNIVHLQDTRI